jgi:PRTRC genetic system protein B
VTALKDAPPALGPAQPLTVAFIESLVRSLGGGVQAEVLPQNVLAKTDRMIVWWTPAQRRPMFYENSEGKASKLNGRVFPQPPLVWRVSNNELNIRALIENKRPEGTTKLAVAPFWNLSDDGRVCTDTMRRPDSASVAAIPAWERGFYESAFTHANVGRLTRHEGGFEGLWTGLAGKHKQFPFETLIVLPQTNPVKASRRNDDCSESVSSPCAPAAGLSTGCNAPSHSIQNSKLGSDDHFQRATRSRASVRTPGSSRQRKPLARDAGRLRNRQRSRGAVGQYGQAQAARSRTAGSDPDGGRKAVGSQISI